MRVMERDRHPRRTLGVYIHIGEAEKPEGVQFTVVYGIGTRVLLGGMEDDTGGVAALFRDLTADQLHGMVAAVTSGRERVA